MPKDEFDFDDPLELHGMSWMTPEDTTDAMAECVIEEFMRLGYNSDQILALFRNRFYIGTHMILERRGEPFVRRLIGEVFERWGRPLTWARSAGGASGLEAGDGPAPVSVFRPVE